ncbi:linker for activation of T-cells family member 1-like isoform X4 [Struthio camelus]|uniref:linker for activation of T-cells family member 1-like isoform X4 n=1 Tax=Struthio camelus TaxID=8801 RepID=UPI0024CDC4AE|nr:TPA_inf: linker for activation of T cells [Struthio camelus]
MDALWPAGLLWGLLLLLPTALLAALCACCRQPRGHGAQIDNYEYKPPACAPANSFMLLTRPSCPSHTPIKQQTVPSAEPFLSIPRSPQAPQSRKVSFTRPEPDNDSVPSYENEAEAGGHPRGVWPRAPSPAPPAAPEAEDDYNNDLYATGYVEVLPDAAAQPGPPQPPQARDSGSSAAPGEEYENVPDAHRHSLADSLEYVNVPEGGASPAPRYASESEEDAPDYENLQH